MDYGVTKQGFKRPSFDEIREEVTSRVREIMGPINTGPESLIGQQINAQVERESLIWEAMEAVYLSQYPGSASGRSLDQAVQLTGIARLGATETVVDVELTGDPGTEIPQGSEASTTDGDIFFLESAVELDGDGFGAGVMRAREAGAILALAGTLVEIETPVSGWDAVTNPDDGVVGREVESDAELRQRREESLTVAGSGTVEAIRARLLQDVADVIAVSIVENRSGEVDADGRPPHSFEIIISGGSNADVAAMIWSTKPAGIETHGDITEVTEDSQGVGQAVKFTRPEPLYIWVKVELTPNGTGDFPGNAEEVAKESVVDFGASLGVGDDVIFQALYGPLYKNIGGLKSVVVEVAASYDPAVEPDPGDFAAENISVGSIQVPLWAEDRIEVTVNE